MEVQEKSYMETRKPGRIFKNDIAFSNWCRRVEALEKRLYKMEKYTVRIDEKVAHVETTAYFNHEHCKTDRVQCRSCGSLIRVIRKC